MLPSDRILLVEDNPDELRIIEHVFKEARIANFLEHVSSAEEAIAYLSGTGKYADRHVHPLPCLVLLDLKLPGATGFDVLNWVRAHPILRKLAVVVLTHSGEKADIDRAYGLGANSYLVKPLDLDELRGIVKAINAYWVILAEKPRLAE
jgi:CheY-like chemotaxis protein